MKSVEPVPADCLWMLAIFFCKHSHLWGRLLQNLALRRRGDQMHEDFFHTFCSYSVKINWILDQPDTSSLDRNQISHLLCNTSALWNPLHCKCLKVSSDVFSGTSVFVWAVVDTVATLWITERWTNPVLLFIMKLWDGGKINWSLFQMLADRVFVLLIVSYPQNVVGFSGCWLVGFGFCRKVKKDFS